MPAMPIYETGMRHALDAARRAIAEGDLPYGAVVIAADGTLVATAHDRVATSGDPTRHGEFDSVRAAIAVRGGDLSGCILVSTVEPCAMCSGAAWNAGIAIAVFGLSMRELKSLRPDALEEPLGPVADLYAGLARRIEAVPGVLRADCLAVWTGR
ncbi:MAG: nucleoside deaminase [Rhodospirillaceae bacterium]|nr:nucleoside deaminase [Rhodospirillaceae bacterium]